MSLSLVEIRSVASEIRRRKKGDTKKKLKTAAVKYKPFGIAMPCGLIKIACFVHCNALFAVDNSMPSSFESRLRNSRVFNFI